STFLPVQCRGTTAPSSAAPIAERTGTPPCSESAASPSEHPRAKCRLTFLAACFSLWSTALDGWAREVRVADTYIDLFETQTYGKLACIEMRNRVLPLGAHWVTAVQRCIDEQERVNALMEAVLARMGLPKVN